MPLGAAEENTMSPNEARCPFCQKVVAVKDGAFVAHAAASGYGKGRKINHCPGFRNPPTGYSVHVTSDAGTYVVEVLREQSGRARTAYEVRLGSEGAARKYAARFA